MRKLKEEFIKYLQYNYLQQIENDYGRITEEVGIKNVLFSLLIDDISALDSDDDAFQFRLKIFVEYMNEKGSTLSATIVMEYICELDAGIKNLRCLGIIDLKKDSFQYENELSYNFLPWITEENYEYYGARFREKYISDDGLVIDTDSLYKAMGLQRVIVPVDDGIYGRLVFENTPFSVQGDERIIEKGTIILNLKEIVPKECEALVRSITLHECLHWHFHRKAFEILMLLDKNYHYFDCRGRYKNTELKEMFGLMEAQANALTSVVLMEEVSFKAIVDALLADEEMAFAPLIILCISHQFNVTIKAAIRRLKQLDYQGVLDGVETVNTTRLYGNRTRLISECQLEDISADPVIKSLLDEGRFIFVEGYIVPNNPAYVQYAFGHSILTKYARENIDSCALIFNYAWVGMSATGASHTHMLYYENVTSKISVPKSMVKQAWDIFMQSSVLSEDEKMEFAKTYREPADGVPFYDYFDSLMKGRGITIKDLATVSGVSTSVIKKYRQVSNTAYSIECVMALCAALNCRPYQSYNLISKAGFNIEAEHFEHYHTLITEHYGKRVESWNALLKEWGDKPLTDK